MMSDVVRLVAVGGDVMQSYIAVLANFGMASRRGALRRLASYCELGFSLVHNNYDVCASVALQALG